MCLLGPRRCRCPVAGNLPGTGIKPGLHVPSAGSSHKPEAHPPLRPKSPSAAWHARGLGSRRHPPARPWDSPARQAPPTPPTQREADAYQSRTTGPSNASHPKRSRRLSHSTCANQSPLEKAGGAYVLLWDPPYRVGRGLQLAGLSTLVLNCQQLEARPGASTPSLS